MTMEPLATGLIWYLVFVFSTVAHEAAHALAAHRLGDPTAWHGGQVSLNPVPHIRREVVGMVVMPLLSFFTAGWMIGWASTPYDAAWARRWPRRAALMALAGPAANLLLVLAAAAVVRLGLAAEIFSLPDSLGFTRVAAAAAPGWEGPAFLASLLFSLNLLLLCFNLIPLPPLDGSAVLPLLLPQHSAARYLDALQRTPFAFLGLLLAWKYFGEVFRPVYRGALHLLYAGLGG